MSFLDEWMSADDSGGGGFKPVPEGIYTATASDLKLDMMKEPARITIIYTIDGPDQKGRKLFANYRLQGQGLGILKRDIKTLGVDLSQIQKLEDIATQTWNVLPKTCEVKVAHREYNGKTYENVYLNRATSGAAKEEMPF